MADWKEQSLRLWQNIGKKEKYIILGSAVLLFVGILAWSFWWGGRPDSVPLFTGLDAKDAGEVAAKLKEAKIPYEIGNNGTAIMVSSKDVYKIRLDLAAQGLPRGNKGFEIFDQNKFGTTEFQNKVYYLQAIQGELTKTIEQMTEVEKARVHIVMPEDSLYKKNEKPATASIMIKLRPSAQLNPGQINGIVNLVAHSVQGLKPENITIVDDNAHVLNDPSSQEAGKNGAISLTQLEMTKKVQDDLQKNLQSMLEQVLGEGKVAARINVELNFDQRVVDRNTFEPVVDDKGIIRSSQDVSENYRGTSNAPGGVPGTTTNIPGYVANNNNQSNYEKKESVKNYEINETKEKTVASPGSIRRLTVAVLVDGSITNVQQDVIMRTVASATGLNPTRGDTISVETVPFSTELADKKKKEEADLEQEQKMALYTKIGLAVLLLIALVVGARMYARKKQSEKDLELMAMAPTPVDELLEEEETEELTPEEIERNNVRESIEKFAQSNPEDVAQLLKTWVSEE
ncbi:MAG: flagellar basal-body MS-ring/collar protein FliF [Sporomusaceae bacterium]|nr:flagellar basal-body MS-ring/collar protein FliF [Sporomusaceae bacterium]